MDFKDQMQILRNQMQAECRRHNDAMDALDRQIRDLQKQCAHDQGYIFTADPSGNADSSRECKICGKEL